MHPLSDATAAQVEANDHQGHCHALREHPKLSGTIGCCRPRNHTGMHSSCGASPTRHGLGTASCFLWYTADQDALVMSHG